MPVISSRISGWRVTDSMTLPKMMPMPTPAPTAPSPPPTPSAMARPASEPASAWAKIVTRENSRSTGGSLGLVALGDRAAEVDGSQSGEDERLQRRDEAELEQVQGDAERQREDAEDLQAEDDPEAARHEEDDQVAGEQVREETNAEREEPHEVREDLEDED